MERDHWAIKRVTKPKLNYKSFRAAARTAHAGRQQRQTKAQPAGLYVAVRDDHDCGAVLHNARAAVQGVLLRHRVPLHDLGVSPSTVPAPALWP